MDMSVNNYHSKSAKKGAACCLLEGLERFPC